MKKLTLGKKKSPFEYMNNPEEETLFDETTIEEGDDDEEVIKELEIDLYNLHTEVQKQPNLLRKHAKIYAHKKRKMDNEKTNLKVVEFEVAKDIKDNPTHYGLEKGKVTDTILKMAIPSSKQYQRQYKKFLNAQEEHDTWNLIKDATRDRTYNIKSAIELYLANYFGDVEVQKSKKNRKD
jgi:hypothetical protein